MTAEPCGFGHFSDMLQMDLFPGLGVFMHSDQPGIGSHLERFVGGDKATYMKTWSGYYEIDGQSPSFTAHQRMRVEFFALTVPEPGLAPLALAAIGFAFRRSGRA